MREGPSQAVLAGAARRTPQVSSWKGATLLAESVPITRGRITANVDQDVPERLTITVPRYADGRSWVPDDPDHPLSESGQILDVDITVGSSLTGIDSTTRVGRFRIQDWDDNDDGSVTVEALGLLQIVADDRFTRPQAPRPSGTLGSEAARLLSAGLGVTISDELVDRAVPLSFQWDEDRLAALYEIADAWPARLRVDQYGTVRYLPPLPAQPVPLVRFTDGAKGTLISAPRSGTRDGVYNIVVGRSNRTDDPASAPLQAVATVTDGPLTPDQYGPSVKFWSSPLAATQTALEKAVASILATSIRPSVVQQVRCVPDPRIELDDAVEVVRRGVPRRGWVVGYSLPLTVEDGDMTVEVGLA